VRALYGSELSIPEKIERVAKEIYGASGVYLESGARKKLERVSDGFERLPVCIAKTQSSFSDNPKLLGAPSCWTLTVTDVHLAAGAGFVVVIAGNMLLMPGLGKSPQAVRMEVDAVGVIRGVG
jgi:formate--tetrahydrofolate ligase